MTQSSKRSYEDALPLVIELHKEYKKAGKKLTLVAIQKQLNVSMHTAISLRGHCVSKYGKTKGAIPKTTTGIRLDTIKKRHNPSHRINEVLGNLESGEYLLEKDFKKRAKLSPEQLLEVKESGEFDGHWTQLDKVTYWATKEDIAAANAECPESCQGGV